MKTSLRLIIIAWLCLTALSGCGSRDSTREPVAPSLPSIATSVPQPLTPTPLPARVMDTPTPMSTLRPPSATVLTPGGITARLNQPFTLKPSQWATLPDSGNTRVFFTNVLEDTRCAVDIDCFQAGSVRVAVTMESGSPSRVARFDLSSKPTDYRQAGEFAGYLIQYVDIAPVRTTANIPIPLGDYQLTLRVSTAPPGVTQARFNEPFTLKLGQSVGFDGSAMRLSFEAVKQDSRCPARVLCVTSGTAAIAVRLVYDNVNQEQIILGVDGNPVMTSYPIVGKVTGYVRANALTPYPQQEFASGEIGPNEYAATFVVVNPAVPLIPTPGGTPAALAPCPDLTRGDAAEILGEALKEQPALMILFQPPDKSISLKGLCGYGSVAFTRNKITPGNLPGVIPPSIQSDHAVIAGKLTDVRRQEQLLSLVSAVDAAGSRGASALYDQLLAGYYAGIWSRDALGDFPDAARGAVNVHVSKVGSLGDSAIWVWRDFDGGHYAALFAQKGETLFVITALASVQRTEDDLLATMTSAMRKMMQ